MVVPYLKAGFESGEYCVWTIPDSLTQLEARQALNQILPGLGGILPIDASRSTWAATCT